MTRSQLVAAALIRALAVVVLGAALAAIVAALMSPLFPTGLARVAEPDPGFHLDPTTLVVGALGIVLVIGLLLALPAWRSAKRVADRDEAEGERSSLLASALGRTMLPPSGRAGVRMALEPGRGHTAVPVRTTIASVSVGIATLLAALTFGASLTHLLGTPSLYGVTWDVQVYANQQVATQKVARELVSAARAAPET